VTVNRSQGRTAAVAAGLAALLLYLALRNVEWSRVWVLIAGARIHCLALSCALALISYFLRSLRWRALLNAEGRLGVSTVFWATMAGYLGNNLLPARAGELVRTLMISGRSGLSKTYVLTTALTERLVDAIVLVAIGSIVLTRIQKGPSWLAETSRGAVAVAAAGLAALWLLPRLRPLLQKLVSTVPLPLPVRARLLGIVEQLVLGVHTLHHPGRLAGFASLTACIWLLDATGSVIAADALGLSLSFPVALLLLAGLGLGSALPSTPGYIGIYQFVAVTVLAPFGFSRSDALAYILVAQFFNYLVVGSLGAVAVIRARSPSSAAEHE
jgi:glycosyltransferase 2 family protein